jgi:type II restriction/modification system DNA methylase subunit YeeA
MNRNKLKTYAPQARRDFIQAVTDRATQFGLTAKKIEPMTEQGEVVLIAGQPFPKSVGAKRKKLEARIQKLGFDQTMEAMAYTWFNRLVAIRFMELHGYLEHGFRVLSHPDGHTQPELLEHAQHVDLPGLDQKKVVELKLDGTKEEELYRLLLLAQCNALHKALPFLFETIDDETELLLPDLLLHSDSLIRNLVNEIPEEDWQEVEIIGWLYQFYISDKKDEVIGKVVASEDIPAATQLFTPNWIVKYLVQNTLGRQWLATYPQSALRQQMEYYIEPAEQTPEVQEQLKAITPTILNPEELTLLDPACGSGHILVEAYDLFKAIYQERGYSPRAIPALILTKNLFGLEIDDRAAQLAAFALMMKARTDASRIFDSEAKPNILSFENSQGMNAADIAYALNSSIPSMPDGHVSPSHITALLALFENAKTFGSLIQIPPSLATKLPDIEQRLNEVLTHGDLTHTPAHVLKPLLQQARYLSRHYNAVVANPPFMGNRDFGPELKVFLKGTYKTFDKNLFSAFIIRGRTLTSPSGLIGFVTPFVWLFISSYESLRRTILTDTSIVNMVKPSYTAFFEVATVQFAAFVLHNMRIDILGTYLDLGYLGSAESQPLMLRTILLDRKHSGRHLCVHSDFLQIPGTTIAFWTSPRIRNVFAGSVPLENVAPAKHGMSTGNNAKFLRRWFEVGFTALTIGCKTRAEAASTGKKWFPYNKGGEYRKWYGNNEFVVNYQDNGRDMRQGFDDGTNRGFRHDNFERYFSKSLTWSFISSYSFGVRYCDNGFIFDVGGSSAFPENGKLEVVAGLLCSKLSALFMQALNPTANMQVGNVASIPFFEDRISVCNKEITSTVKEAIALAKIDWDMRETSWDFALCSLIDPMSGTQSLSESFRSWESKCRDRIARMKELEEENNRLFIEAYELQDELSPEIPDDEITLYRPDREEDTKRLISYAIGCMMGRYSLDDWGLIYAKSGNLGFDASRYTSFPADEDGILPLTESNWFPDDAASRFEKFIATVWPTEHLHENLNFVAESLGSKKGESPRETIRRYVAAEFYKHHISMYKKRPIYWLFSSGKQRGFQALVYLHRYNEGTLARMRTEYVIPLLGKMTARIDHLADDIAAASSSQHRKRLETDRAIIVKQLSEVQSFEEKLRNCADQRIKLDLDDGVKANYGKFGDLLAEVKAITGGNSDE